MSPFRNPIHSFLKTAKTTLSSSASTRPPLTIVVGNQSADLDSILSAVVLAYILQSQSPAASNSTRQRAYIPLTNLGPSDLLLRTELVPVLSRANLQPSDLLTLHDLPKSFSSGEPQKGVGCRTTWILVDHNNLELPFSNPEWNVSKEDIMGCIDHHNDENYILPQTPTAGIGGGVDMRIIQKSGSCMSLIVNFARTRGSWKDNGLLNREVSLSQEIGPSSLELEAQTAFVALAPILIDTANLKDSYKTTESDLEAVKFLEGKIEAWEISQHSQGRGKDPYIRDAYFNKVDVAKQDLEPLTFQQIMRKDYKEWEDEHGRRVGTSAVVKPFEWMLEKVEQADSSSPKEKSLKVFWDEVKQFVASKVDAKNQGLDMFSIMTAFTDDSGNFKRQILVFPNSETGKKAASSFEEAFKQKFSLEPLPGWETDYDAKVWQQGNLSASRKESGPALREILSSVKA